MVKVGIAQYARLVFSMHGALKSGYWSKGFFMVMNRYFF